MKGFLLLFAGSVIAMSAFTQPNFTSKNGCLSDITKTQAYYGPNMLAPGHAPEYPGQKNLANTMLGITWYDAQTLNWGNVMERLYSFPDGTVGATWMAMGPGTPPEPERGAGYNYFDGNAWGPGEEHVGGPDRHGWPNYGAWGANGEIIAVYRYVTGEGPILFYKRENKGTGDWTETVLNGPEGTSIVWHAMMTSGDDHEHIHLLALTYDADVNGQENALLYYRSSDGAETWDIEGEAIDGLGDDYYFSINSLSYDWANPVGETIAFTYGFDEFGGRVFKSYDNGDSWEFIEVLEAGIDPLVAHTLSDTVYGGSGSSSIVLDPEGNAHVVFGRMRSWIEGDTRGYFPYVDGLVYWREGMDMFTSEDIEDYDALYESGNIIAWLVYDEYPDFTEDQPSYASGLCSLPQMTIDDEGNMFVAYSCIAPEYNNFDFFYHHIFAVSSWDGGDTWVEPIDLNTDFLFIFSECAFPTMTPVVNGNDVHIVFQEDSEPGIAIWLEDHTAVENHAYHMSFEKSFFVGIDEGSETLKFEISEGYPNPSDNLTYFKLNMEEPASVTMNVVNLLGQNVKQQYMGTMHKGQNLVSLEVADLISGVYYCIVEIGDESVTRKIVVH